MTQTRIPVDLFNPGQVFACLGLVEAANQLLGDARGAFDWRNGEYFVISADSDQNPIQAMLDCLANAKVESLAPENSGMATEKWDVATTLVASGSAFSIAPPTSPATLPARLSCEAGEQTASLEINHWGDATRRDSVKFWAGAGGYPGVALLRDALDLIRNDLADAAADPFALSCPQSSSFRFDWRRDYIPLDAGFSPNEHTNVVMMGYPIVEIMATIGLTHARPQRASRGKLEYRYGVLGLMESDELYDPIFLRATLGCADLGFPRRDFLMQLGWPGQEGQARCITNVTEETQR